MCPEPRDVIGGRDLCYNGPLPPQHIYTGYHSLTDPEGMEG